MEDGMTDLGDLVPLAVKIRDASGAPMNASSVTLTISLPDGTTTSPFVANPPTITGEYNADFVPTQYGRHRVHWVSTGPAVAFDDIFDVRDPSSTSLISLVDAKRHLNIPLGSTTDDEELRQFIEASTYAIERHRNEVIARRVFTEPVRPSGVVQLDNRPVIRLISLTSPSTTWNVLDWAVDQWSGVITGSGLSGDVTAVYEAGYVQVPAHYVLACKIVLAHLWQTQRIATAGPQTGFGIRNQTQGQEQILTTSGFGNALPPRAVELLGPRPSMIV
jgi:hypothetical protein